MDYRTIIIEGIGYLGSALVVFSMLMTSVKRLRIVNTTGSIIFATYAFLISSYPTAIMNLALVIINIVNLIKLEKAKKNYNLIECYKDESIVQLYLKENINDIKKFFPDFDLGGGHLLAFMVCVGSEPVGVSTGKMEGEDTFLLELDYTIPKYRDYTVGKYILEYMYKKWDIKTVKFNARANEHEPYLSHLGFEKTPDGYVKNLP